MRLKAAFDDHCVVYATVRAEYSEQVRGAGFHVIRDATRWDRWAFVVLAWQVLRILLRERPDVVITTGAAPGALALTVAKCLGARTVWIDSVANVDEMSLSGRCLRRIADVWLTQWPHLASGDGPGFEGHVL
jgi:UDP-N-acetylglucosamine:LPS N-acetylglucosamine transferase